MARVLVAEAGASLRVWRGGLYIVSSDGVRTPVTPDVDQVIIASSRVSITAAAIRRAAEMGIDIVVLGARGHPVARLFTPTPSRTVAARLGQYEARHTGLSRLIAGELVAAKIWNQGQVLKYLSRLRGLPEVGEAGYHLDTLVAEAHEAVREEAGWEERLRSVEARAARVYWQSIALAVPRELGFHGRDQDAPDPLNSALNYGYAILYATCEKALTLAGLDPYIGLYHVDKSGRPSLALDFMEPYRPIAVDKPLIIAASRRGFRQTPGGLLDYESRLEAGRAVLEALKSKVTVAKRRRRLPLERHIQADAWELASAFRGTGGFEGPRVRL
jgi:CRISPR-associated protein Cas1